MWLGLHEPVNTITNAAILIAAYIAYRHIKRSGQAFTTDLVLLLFFLVSVGIGSALWHGLRTFWALQLDWIPGVLYLLVLTALWIRQLTGWITGLLGMAAMLAISIASVGYFGSSLAQITPNLRFAPFYVTVAAAGIIMVAGTWRKFGAGTASLGIGALLFGIGAAVARSIDMLACPVVPFGTHFLWHIGLSTAACLGIFLMVRMKEAGRAR
jgi:Alkaline phytoceramidase (aPHC).